MSKATYILKYNIQCMDYTQNGLYNLKQYDHYHK